MRFSNTVKTTYNNTKSSGAVELTASSMAMEVKGVTEALQFLATSAYKKAVIATDSMSTVQKIQRSMLHSNLTAITWLRPTSFFTKS